MPSQLYKIYSRIVFQFLKKEVLKLYAFNEGQVDIVRVDTIMFCNENRKRFYTHSNFQPSVTDQDSHSESASLKETRLSSWTLSGPPCVQKELLLIPPLALQLAHGS